MDRPLLVAVLVLASFARMAETSRELRQEFVIRTGLISVNKTEEVAEESGGQVFDDGIVELPRCPYQVATFSSMAVEINLCMEDACNWGMVETPELCQDECDKISLCVGFYHRVDGVPRCVLDGGSGSKARAPPGHTVGFKQRIRGQTCGA